MLDLLFRGADTRAIAERLVIEPGTVQDHVKAILTKTGHATRRELLASVVAAGADRPRRHRPHQGHTPATVAR